MISLSIVNPNHMTVNESSKADVILQGDHIKRAEHLLGVAGQESEIIYDPDQGLTTVTVSERTAKQVSKTLSDGELEVAGILSFQNKAEHLRADCLGEASCPNPSTIQAEFREELSVRHMFVRCCEEDGCKEIAASKAIGIGIESMAS
jgi:hypothetical protein